MSEPEEKPPKEEPPKVRLYTLAEFAELAEVSYWTIRKMLQEGAIYENEIVRFRKGVRIKYDAYDRLVNETKSSRPRRKKTPEEECARHRYEQARENVLRELRSK